NEVLMDRGALARIDRRILSELGRDESYRMVRVPSSEALWSTWRRYCGVLGMSMGRAIAGLIVHELGTASGPGTDSGPLFASELQRQMLARAEDLDARERRLDERERALGSAQLRLQARSAPLDPSAHAKTSRNDRCPCGSGLKYKRCHGS
ncbi:MAG: SEC-C metal-binding domain-containing protein, partial [Acidimicrobiia bacterium]